MPPNISRYWPFAASTTKTQAITYLLGVSLFSISFLVFLNSSVSFVVTDLIGQKKGVGDVVGTLGFADEVVALVACPAWGLVSDRLGVRWVVTLGYAIIGVALAVVVQAENVYPQLLLARIFFAVGASAAATMVTAILPSLTDEGPQPLGAAGSAALVKPNTRLSVAYSVESEATITPESYTRTLSQERALKNGSDRTQRRGKPSALAGLVGCFTGCGALVALALFLPLSAKFGERSGVTPGEAVSYSFYVVGAVSLVVAVFVYVGLRNLKGEEGKGWKALLGIRRHHDALSHEDHEEDARENERSTRHVVPYLRLMRDSVRLGFTDRNIALGYLGGFVARASTVAISLFIPLYVNTYFIDNGFCHGSPNDPSSELKKECRAAYVLSSILSGVAQLVGLLCAPFFGFLSGKARRVNYPVVAAGALGVIGYAVLPQLASPEVRDVQGRGGGAGVLIVVALLGISQIGAIVCSLGSLGRGVLAVRRRRRRGSRRWSGQDDYQQQRRQQQQQGQRGIGSNEEGTTVAAAGGGAAAVGEASIAPGDDESAESDPLMDNDDYDDDDDYDEEYDDERDNNNNNNNEAGGEYDGISNSSTDDPSSQRRRVRLKGSIAGVYSLCGGAAILLLTKVGGLLFDRLSHGAPFYMMAGFNAVWLVVSLLMDASLAFSRR